MTGSHRSGDMFPNKSANNSSFHNDHHLKILLSMILYTMLIKTLATKYLLPNTKNLGLNLLRSSLCCWLNAFFAEISNPKDKNNRYVNLMSLGKSASLTLSKRSVPVCTVYYFCQLQRPNRNNERTTYRY